VRLVAPALATAAPLLYYAILPHIDVGWAHAQYHTSHNWLRSGNEAALLIMLPVAVIALPGYLRRATSTRERLLRLWPIAIVAVFLAVRSDKFHAFAGWAIPAALLIARGSPWYQSRLRGLPRRMLAALAVGGASLVIVPAAIELVHDTIDFRGGSQHAAEIPRDDARALNRIAASPLAGGVLTAAELGHWVPILTDRPTWIGHPTWTPTYDFRSGLTGTLFGRSSGSGPAAARAFVRSTGARFVLQPCGYPARLQAALRHPEFSVSRVGCATKYTRVG
jgi:hypothetical protein